MCNFKINKAISLKKKKNTAYSEIAGEIAYFYRKSKAKIFLPGLHCLSYPAFMPQE